ncbi:MAG: PD40 domain-containing protein [Phycisphaeraceae bacterium]|nr:PD40 domain-containing protein [Phycisphaeraceae bacterium]
MGQHERAENELLKLTRAEFPIAGAAHYLLVRIYLRVDPAKADKHKLLAESMLPKDAEGFYLRGMTAASADEALTWLSGAVELDHTHYAALKARTFAYYSLKMYEKMAVDAGILIDLHPSDYMGYALHAIALREIGQFELALKDHARAIALCSSEDELPRLYDQRRVTYMRNGDYEAVLQDAKKVAELKGEEVGFSGIEAWLGLQEFDRIEAEYKRLAKLNEGSVRYFKANLGKHVFDLLRRGQPVILPPDIASRSPFYVMEEAAELYTRLTEKAELRPIPGGLWLEDWSPDGQTIVYNQFKAFSWLPGTLEGITPQSRTRSVEIMDLASGKTRLVAKSGYNLSWSPDGKHIAFSDFENEGYAIWWASLAGGPPRRLASGLVPNWSQDSQHIFFRAESKTLCSKSINQPDAPPVTVMEAQAGRHFGSFSISPDESLIAFEESNEILVLTFPEGKEVVRWEIPWPLQPWSMQLQWHPDGKTVVLNSTSEYNQMGMCLFNIERAEVAHVFNVTSPWCRTIWSPDGSQLMVSPYSHEDAWLLNIDPNIPLTEALAPALTTEGFLAQQLEKWNQRIETDAQYADNYVSRAVIWMAMKDFDSAGQDLNRCAILISEPNDPAIFAINHWADMYKYGGRTTEAQLWSNLKAELVKRFPVALAPAQSAD